MKIWTLSFLCTLFIQTTWAQKTIQANRVEEAITIDGKLDEAIWQNAEVAGDFITRQPKPGLTPAMPTEVKIVYDDHSIYVGAFMKEAARDSIMTQLTERDNIGNTDFFGFYIDTYKKANDAFEFILASTGVQFDAKLAPYNEDSDWDAVWFGATELTEDGWYAEMQIPYAAIRFPKEKIQDWNVNFFRRRAVSGEMSNWQEVIQERDNPFLTQMGSLQGVKDIKPPVRLSISPYASTYVLQSHDPNRLPINSTGYSYNGGLDLKYGINDAFTLDMTLIPDFGQVESDDQVLNLSPFEIQFSDKRPFFTEGLELFSKGDVFYSRRVGGTPIGFYDAYNDLSDQESVIDNPNLVQLYNASKISGRTAKGWGIGVFNAVAAPSEATVENAETGVQRKIKTAPLTNYNVFVVDKTLPNNSNFSITNTNVWRRGSEFYDANVTATDFNLKTKNQKYGLIGVGAVSQIINADEDNVNGYKWELLAEKLTGDFVFGVSHEVVSENFNPNDLGFLRRPNTREYSVYAQLRKFNGLWKFQQFQSWFNARYNRLQNPDVFTGYGFNGGFWGQNKNFWNFNMWTNYVPKTYDYFEPRVAGRYFYKPAYKNIGFWMGSDSRKKLRVSLFGFVYDRPGFDQVGYELGVNPRFRFNDKFTVSLDATVSMDHNERGFVDTYSEDEIFFGIRDRTTISNLIGSKYTFNDKMNINFRLRHYWSKVEYSGFQELMLDGSLTDSEYNEFNDFSFNSFNIDLVYQWRFAPGSDIFVVWKNNINGYNSDHNLDYSEINYKNGVQELGQLRQDNSLSVRVVYFLDYNDLKRRF